MVEMRLDEIAARTGGRIVRGNPTSMFGTFNIDSRLSRRGELFFAIVAKRDGHEFIPDAHRRGARGAVISRDIGPIDHDFALIRVADTLAALEALARSVVNEFRPRVIGITGSIGKTTTKNFTADLLSRRFRVLKSEKNFNNRLGLPLSLLKFRPGQEIAVLEMGTSAPGEILALTRTAPPDVAVITNVNPVHLEFFHDLEAVAQAKKEILDGMKPDGTAVLNGNDDRVKEIGRSWTGRRITFGFSPDCNVQAGAVRKLGLAGLVFKLRLEDRSEEVRFPFFYEDYVSNVLAAVGAAHSLSLPFETIVETIPRLSPSPGRGRLIRLGPGCLLVDDSYNSSPKALEAALKGLASLPAKRRIAALGDMLELGPEEIDFHRRAGKQVVAYGWDELWTVGPLARHIATGALAAGLPENRVRTFTDSEEAAGRIHDLIREGDLILVKGSRGIKTELLVERLEKDFKES
jgi:UDP-N-acetylmuramoyl-tripeptide--D-alanyl-D-alanine ligase